MTAIQRSPGPSENSDECKIKFINACLQHPNMATYSVLCSVKEKERILRQLNAMGSYDTTANVLDIPIDKIRVYNELRDRDESPWINIICQTENGIMYSSVTTMGKCYDAILKAHRRVMHGSLESTKKALTQYVVPPFFLEIFIDLCVICNINKQNALEKKLKEKEINGLQFNFNIVRPSTVSCPAFPVVSAKDDTEPGELFGKVHINFVGTEPADGAFKGFMIYFDRYSGYNIIRPMTSFTNTELTLELSKIISDFGEPKLVLCFQIHFDSINTALVNLKQTFDVGGISLVTLKPPAKIQDEYYMMVSTTITNKLNHWVKSTNCKQWSIGCLIVQQMMNERLLSNGQCPREMIFEQKGNIDDDKAMEIRVDPPSAKHTSNSLLKVNNQQDTDVEVDLNKDIVVDESSSGFEANYMSFAKELMKRDENRCKKIQKHNV